MMAKVQAEIPPDLSRQIERIIRDGWFPDQEAVVREALVQFVTPSRFSATRRACCTASPQTP